MAKTEFSNPFKSPLEIKRYPPQKSSAKNEESLHAWDSADELILEQVWQHFVTSSHSARILVINDSFGSLSCALEGFDLTTYTDSFVAAQGIRMNSGGRIQPIHDFKSFRGIYDLVLIKLPKNTSFFEDILCHLTSHLNSKSKVICASMIKHMAKSSFDHLQKIIGPTTTSLAQKKARLIFASFEKSAVQSPYPFQVQMESFELAFVNHSNLFSREKLDIGTRFFLENIPQGDFKTILDLGCANGIVGIQAKKLNPSAKIIFSDESAMALESARVNFENHFPDAKADAQYVWTHCFENQKPDSVDLVLCNPPFHQQNTVGDFIAWQMFTDARVTLRVGGLLRVIGNRHLGYDLKLKRIFKNAKVVATNPKFTVVDSKKY